MYIIYICTYARMHALTLARTHTYTHTHTHTHLGTSGYISHDIPDHEVQAFTVAGGVVVKRDIALSGPPLGGSMVLNDWRGLHNQLGVVHNTRTIDIAYYIHLAVKTSEQPNSPTGVCTG